MLIKKTSDGKYYLATDSTNADSPSAATVSSLEAADDDWDGHQIFTGVSDCDPPSPNGTPHGGVVKIKRFLPGTPPRLHYDVGCVTPDNTPPTP